MQPHLRKVAASIQQSLVFYKKTHDGLFLLHRTSLIPTKKTRQHSHRPALCVTSWLAIDLKPRQQSGRRASSPR